MSNKKISLQMIGHGLDPIAAILKEYGIITENLIGSCNPLAMAGKTDGSYFRYCEDQKASMIELLNIRKNLAQMLSHDQDNFCQNFNLQPPGAEVRRQCGADYLIFMNSSLAHPLYEKNGVVYSRCWPEDSFVKEIMSDKSYTLRFLPYSGDFNWKYYYDQFIDAVLNEFDKDHIILIRTNSAQWYMNEQNICAFEERSSKYRNAVEEIDNYFIERTACIVVDENYNHIPHCKINNAFPYIIRSDKANRDIANIIENIVCGRSAAAETSVLTSANRLISVLTRRLCRKVLKENEDCLKLIAEKNLSLKDIESKKYSEQNGFFADIIRLKDFLSHTDMRSLSEYATGLLADKQRFNELLDFELVELYTRYFKLNINDVIAFYMIYECCENKNVLRTAAENIFYNEDCLPAIKAKKLIEDNKAFIKGYEYINDEFKNVDVCGKIYISLENNSHIVLEPGAENVIAKVDLPNTKDGDYLKVINDGYVCPIDCADALTYSLEYYAEKARRGDGAKPTYLKFTDINEFVESLRYTEYRPLLENENFVFSIGDTVPRTDGYEPSVDFTELTDPDTVLINIRNGLGDQICHFMMGQAIEEMTGRRVIYFDLPLLKFLTPFGSNFSRITKYPVKLFSQTASPRLCGNYIPNNDSALSFLLRIYDFNLVVNSVYYNHRVIQNELKRTGINGVYVSDDLKRNMCSMLPNSYYFNLMRMEELKSVFDYRLSDYIDFPPFEEASDIELSDKMLSCDAVVVHVRRGDRVTLGINEDINFYPEAIEKIMNVREYKDKKFFVFSDDINWCRTHRNEIGLDRVGNCEVAFLDGRTGEESFRDIQLMTYGKIMIFGNSGFPRIAAMYSDRWEMLFCAIRQTYDFFQNHVRKNKYETTPFLKNDYSHSNR